MPARRRPRALIVRWSALILLVAATAGTTDAVAEQASEPTSPTAGQLDAGGHHTCALDAGAVRCWGLGFNGQLGYGNQDAIGDDEAPGAAGIVELGPGRFATAISAGDFHTCALLDDGTVRCWGFGGDGRLGYGNVQNVGDDETPASVGPVNLGAGRTATAISAGGAHTCAVLDTGSVLCWGFGEDGRLGYGDTDEEGAEATIGDDEAPGSVAPVQIGDGRTATAITAGSAHTCVLLDDGNVRCWGTNGSLFGGDGRLGYGTAADVGDDETPASVEPLELGGAATAITAGDVHTCAVLIGGDVRCWGDGVDGRLGYADEMRIGDNETPDAVAPVSLGGPAAAISAGSHTCARLTSGAVRCWGPGSFGRLGYASTDDIGDDEVPAAVPAINIGGGAVAIGAGTTHTCARLGDTTLRCWGEGLYGRLGYGNQSNIGDDETPASAGAIDFSRPPGPSPIGGGDTPAAPAPHLPAPPLPPVANTLDDALARQAQRAADLRACRASAASKRRTARSAARRRYRQPRALSRALRLIDRTAARRRAQCVRRFGRIPARVTSLVARRTGRSTIVLRFAAAGTDGRKSPAATGYVIKQSLRPIRTTRQFDRAPALCGGTCRFAVTRPGSTVSLTVTQLRPRTRYYYAVAARDNVSARRGPRSKTVSIRPG